MEFGSAFALSTPINPAIDVDEIDETDYSAGVRSAMSKNISARGDNDCFLDIIDTAGQEEYSAVREEYTRTAHAFLIVFSITDRQSFEEAKVIYQFCCRFRSTNSIPAVLCANKCDLRLERQVSENEALLWANSVGIPMFTTSAKIRINIEEAFIKLVQITPRPRSEYKIAVLGAGGVGKSAITVQFVLGQFVEVYDPTIEDGYRRYITVPDLPPRGGVGTESSPASYVKRSGSISSKAAISKAAKRSSGFFSSLFGRPSPAPPAPLPTYDQATTRTVEGKSPGDVRKLRKVPKMDANILMLNLGTLSPENFDMLEIKELTSAPPPCLKCSAILSTSQKCVFCGVHNQNIPPEQLQVRRAIEEYTIVKGLQSLPHSQGDPSPGLNTTDKGLVVFCIDISGSMSITKAVNPLQGMWQSFKAQNLSAAGTSAFAPQISTQPPKQTQYISRLLCIQDAMQVHLKRLEKHFPERKVAIVAFHSELECFLGGSANPQVIETLGIGSIEEGMDRARTIKLANSQTVGKAASSLREHVMGLTTKGSTALGPALAFALGLAREHKRETSAATEIFLCTDGASNTGIGTTDDQPALGRYLHGRSFYSQAGELALAQSAKINIIGIKGEGVALDVLAIAGQISGGVVTTVEADELLREIRTASQNRIIARDVIIKLHAHKDWHFSPDPRPGVIIKDNTLTYTRAQVDDETSIGFAFGISRAPGKKAGALSETTPFQAQITYTSPITGDTNVRVLHKALPVTADREQAETAVEVALTGTYLLQKVSFGANQVLIKNLSFGQEAKSQVRALRDTLYATHQLLIRGAKSNQQQEELGNFARESAELDRELERMASSGGGVGSSRDQAAKVWAKGAGLSSAALVSGSKKVSQVKRRGMFSFSSVS